MLRRVTLFFIAITVMHCDSDESAFISGQVVLKNGTPLSEVDIHYVPEISQNDTLKEKLPSRSISFSIAQSGHVKLESFIDWNDQLVETLIDTRLSPGVYNAQINDSLYTNRIYNYKLSISNLDSVSEHRFLFIKSANELIGVKPLVRTGIDGRFELEMEQLGIGEKFVQTSVSSPEINYEVTITNAIEFIAIKNGRIVAVEKVSLDESKQNDVQLVSE